MGKTGIKRMINVKDLVSVGIFTSLLVVLSQVSIPLPFTPVPLTLSLFAVYLSSTVLGFKLGMLVQMTYFLLGMIGFPVFSGFRGGFIHLIGPSGGYLFSYIIITALIGIFTDRITAAHPLLYTGKVNPIGIISMNALVYSLSLGICYSLGSFWLSGFVKMSFFQSLLIGALPYLPLDIVKIAACAVIVVPIKRAYLSVIAPRMDK